MRELAREYLEGDAIRASIVEDNFEFVPDPGRSLYENYSENLRLIAEHAPLRLRRDELLVGAATYLSGVRHTTPGGAYGSISHVTVDFAFALRHGLSGLERLVRESLARPGRSAAERDFLNGQLGTIDAMRRWHRRYVEAVRRRAATEGGWEEVLARIERVPELPAENFPEAMQSLFSFFVFQRLCGNWSGLGRMDWFLNPYWERDRDAGCLTEAEARAYIACFWIKGTEWKGLQYGSGDAQHYQNVILGGTDAAGNDITNDVTHWILDVVEELHISDFPIAVRAHRRMPEALWRRVAAIQSLGGGIVSIYNETVVLAALEKFGFPREDAVDFTNDGCWEVIIPGRTAFIYQPFDVLAILQNLLEKRSGFADFEALYQAYIEELTATVADAPREDWRQCFADEKMFGSGDRQPSSLLALLMPDCIASGRSYCNRGPRYTLIGVHASGLPDAVNELHAIRKLVFESKRFELPQLRDILRRDWVGEEALREELWNSSECYGNDCDAPDLLLRRLVHDFTVLVGHNRDLDGVWCVPGISTFGRELQFAPDRGATAYGARAHQILAPNLGPTPGTDRSGPTAVVKSFCRVDFTEVANGCPLDLKFHPQAVADAAGLAALEALLKSFVELGGFYLQVDVADEKVLRDAQRHPERYGNLSVRISGWSARFTTLSSDWQEMVIQRTAHR